MTPEPSRAAPTVVAVVVDHDAGGVLARCVDSLLANGATSVVVVDNGEAQGARAVLEEAGLGAHRRVVVLTPGVNLGYGAGANRGMAACAGPTREPPDYFLVANPDLEVHPGALRALVGALEARPDWALAGPRVLTPQGDLYPSARSFPSALDAAGHAILGTLWPTNPFTRRYRGAPSSGSPGPTPAARPVDWVSGACMLIRRRASEELGGFDESFFMFAEDMDLCWRARRAGWGVALVEAAAVTHVQGVSTRRHPYRMLVAHHRSALRFAARQTQGWRRAALPAAALILGARLGVSCAAQALRRLG